MGLITAKERAILERAMAVSSFCSEDAMMILQGLIATKNAEILRLKTENEFIVKRLEEFEKEANKGAYY